MSNKDFPRVKYNYTKPMGEAILDALCGKPRWESPITIFQKSVATKIEDDVCKAVFEYGISVDKEELIKALRYDRDQYDKGYRDGCAGQYDHIKREVAREIFEEIDGITDLFAKGLITELEMYDEIAKRKKKHTEGKAE